jgi:hypothetical protein
VGLGIVELLMDGVTWKEIEEILKVEGFSSGSCDKGLWMTLTVLT